MKPIYESVRELEEEYYHPLCAKELQLPFWFVGDTPFVRDSKGVGGGLATYGSPFVEGVTKQELRSPKYSPLKCIWGMNHDCGAHDAQYEKNKQRMRKFTQREAQDIATTNKTIVKNDGLGTCNLYLLTILKDKKKTKQRVKNIFHVPFVAY